MKTPLIPHWSKTLAKRIPADPNYRPSLAVVHLSANGLLQATNSFVAVSIAAARTSEELLYEVSKFPDVGSEKLSEIPEKGLLIPSSVFEQLKFKRSKYVDSIDRKAVLHGHSEQFRRISVSSTDLETTCSVSTRIVDANFPDFEPFFKSAESAEFSEVTGLSVQYLLDVLETFKAAGYDRVVVKPKTSGFIIESRLDGNLKAVPEAKAIVMPLKL